MDDDAGLICEDAPPQGPLFHYTSFDGLNGIVRGKTLWATNIEYLNDRTEFRHGEEILRKAAAARKIKTRGRLREFYNELEKCPSFFAAEDVFVISMSENGDLLSQWRGYTPIGGGFNVGFDPVGLRSATWEPHKPHLIQCRYDDDEKRGFAESFLNEQRPNGLAEMLLSRKPKNKSEKDIVFEAAIVFFKLCVSCAIAKMKDKSFAEEKEWRLLITCTQAEQIRFRMGKSLLTPYIELKWGNNAEVMSLQPIRSVTIGPCPDPDLSKQSIDRFLTSSGNGTVSAENSQIPFRSW